MALIGNKSYILIRKIVEKTIVFEKLLKFFLNSSRLLKAKKILRETNIHQKIINSFLNIPSK